MDRQLDSAAGQNQHSDNSDRASVFAELMTLNTLDRYLKLADSRDHNHLPNASDLLPNADVSKEKAEQRALQAVIKGLAHNIFDDANNSKAGDTFIAASNFKVPHGDYYLTATAEIETKEKGVPKPIEIGSDPVVITPSMTEGAFRELVLSPALSKAFSERNEALGNPINIKLSLGREVLDGTMKLRLTKEQIAHDDN